MNSARKAKLLSTPSKDTPSKEPTAHTSSEMTKESGIRSQILSMGVINYIKEQLNDANFGEFSEQQTF